ncbi:PREDICTED: uncharacterized protein LOC105625499, partial [Atta cephalotes]|uniref:Uncharacterized protein n=1 Tax=Atta cephalotes TaxID=12957 RepID=A0A158NXF7_ATTCE
HNCMYGHLSIEVYLYYTTNIFRSYHLQICTEYFIDERYFCLLFFHVSASFTIESAAESGDRVIAPCISSIACGRFKIASYRIKKTIHIYTLKDVSTQKEILIYKDLICAVDIHRKSMTFSYYFISRLQISFIFLIALLSINLNIFRVRLVFYKSMSMICILFRCVALD